MKQVRRTEKSRIIRAVDQKSKQDGRPAVGLGSSVIMARGLALGGVLGFWTGVRVKVYVGAETWSAAL